MLRGEIAYLSPLLETDGAEMFAWINDRELVVQSAPYRPIHHSAHIEWLRYIQSRSDTVIFGIRRTADDCLLGSCQLHSISAVHRSAELQVRIGRSDSRGHGFGKEACSLLLRHAFEDLNLQRVFLHVFEANERGIRLYGNCGFKVEGTLRKAAFVSGQWCNVLVMAVLREEYEIA